jgi:hypothetical protein
VSDGESIASDPEDDKIPKPIGEAGRPNSGGYSLETVLEWKTEDFQRIQVMYPPPK